MAQNTNLNIAPYFDDFDKSKGFLKVLFKPGFPVQARELTTLQTLLQDQIDTFGQGVYKEGSMVVPGGITLNKDVPCIIIQNNYLNLDVENYRTALDGQIIKGSTSGVRARVLFSISATTSTKSNITFYLNYLQKAEDTVTSTFTAGETFTCESDITYASTTIASGTPLAQLLNSAATFRGSTASIGAGVFFTRGYFVNVAEQTIILDQYDINPSYKVGLKVEERIITADEDASLYDNAIGSTNFSAPGADRFKINLTLVKKLTTAPNSADFIELLRTNTGKIEKKVERSDLGFINDILATRTKEESGNYYVKKFKVDARENLDDGFNNGVYQATDTTSGGATPAESNLSIQLSSGCAYVQGYRTERISTTYKDVDKPRTFDTEQNKTVTSDFGNFVLMTNLSKGPLLYETVLLKDAAGGTTIGQSRISNFAYESGPLTAGSADTVYRANIIDTQFYNIITTSGSATGSAGDQVVGSTSGATGYLVSNVSGTTTTLYGTNGTFVSGESLTKSGNAYGTIASSGVKTYGFGHVKQYAFGSSGSNGTADAVLDVRVALPGSGGVISSSSGSGTSQTGTVTATLSNFVSQLRIGDIVEFTNANKAHEVKVTGITSNLIFTIQNLKSGNDFADEALTSDIIRTRPELKEGNKKALLTPLGYDAVKTTASGSTQPSGRFRVSATKSVSGNTVAIAAGGSLSWVNGTDNDDFMIIVTGGSAAGQIMSNGNGFTTTDVNSATVTISNYGGNSAVSSLIAIGTVTDSNRSGKSKTTERMKVLNIDDSIFNISGSGLTQVTAGFGTRVEDSAISLGCGDVFKIKAIYESKNSSPVVIPSMEITNLLGTIAIDDVITGDESGSRARIVSTTGNTVYFIPIEDDKFTSGETLTAPNATFQITSLTEGSNNITNSYDLDDGQRDQFYDYSRIVRKPGFAAPSHKLVVIFDRFSTSDSVNPYTVDSYSTDDYKIIPSYNGVELRDVIDYRPIVPQALSGSGTQAAPYTLSSDRYFDFAYRAFTNNEVGLPGISDTTTMTLEYYLPRVDKLFLSQNSIFQIVKGAPSTRPQPPEDLEDAMLLATITYFPYVFDVERDVTIKETNYKRYTFRDIQYLEDRIKTLEYYTQLSLLESDTANMQVRDVSGLDRFKNGFIVDNFASLSTADTLHPDYRVSTDFERGQLRPAHYTTQVPLQYSTSSQNVTQTDEIITLPYASTVLIDQPYASAVENVNPFNVFTYTGDIELFPESDNWVDTKSLSAIQGPVVEGNFMTTVREYNADQNGFSPIHWNSWKTTWTGTNTERSNGAWRGHGRSKHRHGERQTRTVTRTTTTTTRQSRTGVRYRVTPVIEQQSLGSKVVSVENIQFMRSRNIEFSCQKLKPRTKFFAFFDGISIPTKLITPKIIGLIKDPSTDAQTNNVPFQIGETVYVKKGNGKFRFKARVSAPNQNLSINPLDGTDISTTSDYTSNLTFINIDTKSLADQVKGNYFGSPKINDYIIGETSGAVAKVSNKDLVTDKKGNLTGSFFIDAPNVEGNIKFKTGTKLFRLSDDSTNSKVVGVSDSSGEAEFSSSGILQTTQETIISVRNAKITSEDQFDERTLTSVSSETTEEERYVDPLAQTFLIEDSSLEGGVFLTKIDLYFFTKDAEIPVALDIRTVVNGNPTQTVLPFSKVVKQSEDVFTSTDASKPTTFTFKAPVFIPYRKEHAMVLTSDSNQYKVFISLLGNDAIDAAHLGEKISEQPYIGVLFKSQNASTWTPSQYEDLMFKIYRAEFTLPTVTAPSRLILENGELGESNGGSLNLRTNPLKTTSGQDTIRVFHSNHGMQSSLNYLTVSGVISEVADTQVNMSGNLSATALSLIVDDASSFHTTIGGSTVSGSNPGFLKILGTQEDGSGDEIIAYTGISGSTITLDSSGRNHNGTSGSSTGKIHLNDAVVQCYNFAGIPLTKINKTHSSGVVSINSPHSYNLQISGVNAGVSVQGGGINVVASQNIPWDVLTPQIQAQIEPQTSMVARVQGTSGTSCGPFPAGYTAETSFVKDSDWTDVTIGEENYFPATKIVANQTNEINRMNSVKSLSLELNLSSEVSHLSPVVDLTRCDMITTQNIINNIEPTAGIGGECAGNYITKVAKLEKSASGLKVMFAANTWTPSKIVVMYKLIPVGYVDSLDDLPFQFFNTTGRPDSGELVPQNDLTTFTDYEYTIEDTDEFDGFQVKISLLSHEQPYIPRVKDFRGIALA